MREEGNGLARDLLLERSPIKARWVPSRVADPGLQCIWKGTSMMRKPACQRGTWVEFAETSTDASTSDAAKSRTKGYRMASATG